MRSKGEIAPKPKGTDYEMQEKEDLPALSFATTPVRTYAPDPNVAPIPNAVKSQNLRLLDKFDGEVSTTFLRSNLSIKRIGIV